MSKTTKSRTKHVPVKKPTPPQPLGAIKEEYRNKQLIIPEGKSLTCIKKLGGECGPIELCDLDPNTKLTLEGFSESPFIHWDEKSNLKEELLTSDKVLFSVPPNPYPNTQFFTSPERFKECLGVDVVSKPA